MVAGRLLDGIRPHACALAMGLGIASAGAGCGNEPTPPPIDAAILPRDANLDAPPVRYVPPPEGYCRLPRDCNDGRTCTEDYCAPSHLGSFEGLCVHQELPMCVEPPDAGPPDAGPDAPRQSRCDPGLQFRCAVPGGCHDQVGWVVVRDSSGVLLYEGCPREGAIVLGSVPLTERTEIVVRYSDSEGPCPGSHRCDRAVFDVELVGQPCGARRLLGRADLDNGDDGGDRGPFTFAIAQSTINALCCR